MDAHASVRYELDAELRRGKKVLRIGDVASNKRLRRLIVTLRILRWNRWAAKDSRRSGVEFPADAPTRLRDVNWRMVWSQ